MKFIRKPSEQSFGAPSGKRQENIRKLPEHRTTIIKKTRFITSHCKQADARTNVRQAGIVAALDEIGRCRLIDLALGEVST